jgi:hypothetical protein
MRPKKHKTMGSNDLFRARLDRLTRSSTSSTSWRSSPARSIGTLSTARSHRSTARRGGLASRRDLRSGCCCSSRFTGLPDEGVCERWVYDPCFQYFTGGVLPRLKRYATTSVQALLKGAERDLSGGDFNRPVEDIPEGQVEHGVEPEQDLRQDRGLA